MLGKAFDNDKPIFLQIKERLEDLIVKGELKENDQVPSTTQLVQFYKINHATVSKGINLLVEAGIIYKKRGVGMFVAEGARGALIEERKETFVEMYLLPMIQEANKLGITELEVTNMMNQIREREKDEFSGRSK